jgi:hypothetical protein
MTSTTPRRSPQGCVAVLVLLAAALAGCSGGGGVDASPSVSPTTSAGSGLTEQLRKAEKNGNAGVAQIAALKAAAAKGSMSYEELDALINDTIACFESSGVDYRREPDREIAPGLKMPAYGIGEPIAVGDKCVAKYSGYAEAAYQTQPSAIEAKDAKFEAARPQVLACLREHGVAIDDVATRDEIERASILLFTKTVQTTDDNAVQAAANCLHPAY